MGDEHAEVKIWDLLSCEERRKIDDNLDYGLPVWFKTISTKRLDEIKDEDIAKLIRQKLFLRLAVCEALKRIEKNPFSGIYDGEIVEQLSKLDREFWLENTDLKKNIACILSNIVCSEFDWLSKEDEDEFSDDLAILKEKAST